MSTNNQTNAATCSEEISTADPECEFCHGFGVVYSPADGWHSTDQRRCDPCPCTQLPEETQMRTRVPMTREDEAIFDRMDSMSPQFIYEDEADIDFARMVAIMRDRIRFDLASPAVRIEG